MASLPPLVSEDQLLCPICLGVLVQPVSTPCGHNFCMSCLSSYWDSSAVSVCPVCKESYSQRPQLRVNTFISGLCQSFLNRPLSAAETQSREMRAELGGTEAKISSMIQEKVQKVQSIRQAVAQRQEESRHLAKTIQDLSSLAKAMEAKQQHVDLEAEKVAKDIEKEIKDLTETQTKLKDLKLSQDVQAIWPNHPNKNAQSKPPAINLESELEIQQLRNSFSASLSQLRVYWEKTGANFISDIAALKYAQQFAKDVTLDPKTAHHSLVLSRDMKQVKFNPDANARPTAASNPARFEKHLAVLGAKGIRSGKFYFEVAVGAKTEWIVGVALASLQRKGKLPHTPGCGVYAVCFRMSDFETFCRPNVPIHRGKIERVGVLVNYEGGRVSFYDVGGAKLIHAFEDCAFAEKVHPYFNPCNDEFENNLGPLAIVPVNPK
ncbi:E3 ubiquitin-protein ligase TRIM69-like [Eucyclogobius newberryi]|uniref:E3 ubiquitin-protein ligase TRIM69-like n=1 Tax=Eucyclogobius newberryi TaxID=166745 RepID=UPI003B5BA8DC